MRRWWWVAVLSCVSAPAWAGKPAKDAKADSDKPEAIVAKIEAKWGKDSAAAVDARQLLADGKLKARWLDTPIGSVAVLEGEALLVVPPSGKPHWWVGDPSAPEKPKTPAGEPVAGLDKNDHLLTLAAADDVQTRFSAASAWKAVPVSPSTKPGRIDVVFRSENPVEDEDGLELVPVTKDAVLWGERNKGGYALVDLDGDKLVDRVRREHLEFAECTRGRCDVVWYEVDKADGKGGYAPAPAKFALPVYKKLAADTMAKLAKAEASGKCKDLRDGTYELYRYALLGGIELKTAKAEVARLSASAKVSSCQTCSDTTAMESQEERREGDVCARGKKVLECLGKLDALTPKAMEDCWKVL